MPHEKKIYYKMYKTFPWYMFAHIISYIIVYNVKYPNQEKLPYLLIDTDKRQHVWRIYTHIFLHAHALHLVSNVVMITGLSLFIGTMMNPQQWRAIIIHSLCAINGAFGIGWEKRLVKPEKRYIAMGASGSAYGLLGVFCSDLVVNWKIMPFRWVRFFVISVIFLGEILLWVYFYKEDVSYSGHLGGFIGGILCSPMFLVNSKTITSKNEIENQNNQEQNEQNEQRLDINSENEEKNIERKKFFSWKILKYMFYSLSPIYTIAGIINYFSPF